MRCTRGYLLVLPAQLHLPFFSLQNQGPPCVTSLGLCTPRLQEVPFTYTTSWIRVLKLGSMVALTSLFCWWTLLIHCIIQSVRGLPCQRGGHVIQASRSKNCLQKSPLLIVELYIYIGISSTKKYERLELRKVLLPHNDKKPVCEGHQQTGSRAERRKAWNRSLMIRADPPPCLSYSWTFQLCDLVKFPPLFSQVWVEPLLLTIPRALANTVNLVFCLTGN